MPRHFATCLLLVLVPALAPAIAAQPQLLFDINTTATGGNSSPRSFVDLAGETYFWSTGPDGESPELWRSAGTPESTARVAACPTCQGLPENVHASRATGRVYFRLGTNPHWLGVADDSGVVALVGGDGVTIDWGSFVDLPSRGLVFFRITTPWAGPEVWATDGTAAGTRAVQRMVAPQHFRDESLLVFGEFVYFIADDGTTGPALWRSDGSPAGTRLVVDLVPRSRTHPAPRLLAAGPRFLGLAGWSRDHGEEPWVSDGSAAGTRRIADLVPGRGGSNVFAAVAAGNQLFFVADTRSGQELHSFDGRRLRTVSNFRSPRPLLDPTGPGAFDGVEVVRGLLVFAANDPALGVEPWVADGRVGGTRLLADVCPGSCSSLGMLSGERLGTSLVFGAASPTLGEEPWITDGTPAGTRVLRDFCRGECSSRGFVVGQVDGRGLVGATGSDGRFHLWRTDGTGAGTRRVFIGNRPSSGSITLDEVVLLGLDDGQTGEELWAWRPESALEQVADTMPGTGDSLRCGFASTGEDLFFVADDGLRGVALWTSRGTPESTHRLAESLPGPGPTVGVPWVGFDGLDLGTRTLVSLGVSEPRGLAGLWSTDGTAAGTLRLADASALSAFQGRGYFASSAVDGVRPLAATDGTLAGTVDIADAPGPVERGVVLGSRLIYVGRRDFPEADPPEFSRFEIWATAGTASSTVLLNLGGDARWPSPLTELDGRVYFTVVSGDFSELWSTDGTPAGTARVSSQLFPFNRVTTFEALGGRLLFTGVRQGTIDTIGADRSWFFEPATATVTEWSVVPTLLRRLWNGHLYFVPGDRQSQLQSHLWQTDGSEAGTRPVVTASGQGLPGPTQLEVVGNQLISFNAGTGLWATDGTAEGTRQLFAVRSECPSVGVVGERVVLGLNTAESGREPWVIEP